MLLLPWHSFVLYLKKKYPLRKKSLKAIFGLNFWSTKASGCSDAQQSHMGRQQCDQDGRFLKVLVYKSCYKSSPNVWWLFGLFWQTLLLIKNWRTLLLGQLLKKLGYFLFQPLVTLLLGGAIQFCALLFVWYRQFLGLYCRRTVSNYLYSLPLFFSFSLHHTANFI